MTNNTNITGMANLVMTLQAVLAQKTEAASRNGRRAAKAAAFRANRAAEEQYELDYEKLVIAAQEAELNAVKAEVADSFIVTAMRKLASALALGEAITPTVNNVEGRESAINMATVVTNATPAVTYGTMMAPIMTQAFRAGLYGFPSLEDALEIKDGFVQLLANGTAPLSTDETLIGRIATEKREQGVDHDAVQAATIRKAVVDDKLNTIVLGHKTFIGLEMAEAIGDLGREAGVTTVYAKTLKTLARLAHLAKSPVTGLADIMKWFDNNRFKGLAARLVNGVISVYDEGFPETTLIRITREGEFYRVNERLVKLRNAVVVGNQPFAAGGDTLAMIADAGDALGIAFGVLAQTLQNRKGYVSNAVYGWLKGLEGMMGGSTVDLRKQNATTRLFNRDNVLGGYTIVETEMGNLFGLSKIRTAGVAGQLNQLMPDAAFMPSAKGDFFITYSADELNSMEHLWFITPSGQLGAHCKGTKHTAAYEANVGNVVTMPVMVMARTPFCQGGAMPIDLATQNSVLSMEDKTMLNDMVDYPTIVDMHEARRSNATRVHVKVGDVIVPFQGMGDDNGLLATVNGKKVFWTAMAAKGAYSARITEVVDFETSVMGKATVKVLIRAVVTYGGAFKGRGVAKVMAAVNTATRTTVEVIGADGKATPFVGGYISGGAFKVTTDLVYGRKAGRGRITREVNMEHMAILVHLYGKGADKPDDRFSYDMTAMTVTWEDDVIIATMQMGIESGPVSEGIGYTGVIPTQLGFAVAADAYGDGIGSDVMRDIFTDADGNDMNDLKAKALAYTKATATEIKRVIKVNATLTETTGWVNTNPDGTVSCAQVTYADIMGERPSLTPHFKLGMSDVEMLETLGSLHEQIVMFAVDDKNVRHSILLNCKMILKLAGGGSPSGKLGGLGHVAADLVRNMIFKHFASKTAKKVSLIRKLRAQFESMAFDSAKLNRVYKHAVGVVAKCIPDWRTKAGDTRVNPNSPWVVRVAKLARCKPSDVNGTYGLNGRHPVMTMSVGQVVFDDTVPLNVVMVGENSIRISLLGDTDGDQLVFIPIRDAAKAVKLKAAIERMIPNGDIKQVVYGISGSHPDAKLFGELPKADEDLKTIFNKDVTKLTTAQWRKQQDEQAYTAVSTCGSAYKMGEFAILLAGLKQTTAKGALVAAVLYEDFGLCGDVTPKVLKQAQATFNMGVKRNNLQAFRTRLGESLSLQAGSHTTVVDERSAIDLGVASEFATCARNGGIPVTENGTPKIDFIGGSTVYTQQLWRIVAVLQAMGRGHIAECDQLILGLTKDVIADAKVICGADNFLVQLAETIERTLGGVVRELDKFGVLGKTDGATQPDDDGLDDEDNGDIDATGYDGGLDD